MFPALVINQKIKEKINNPTRQNFLKVNKKVTNYFLMSRHGSLLPVRFQVQILATEVIINYE